jgi:uncharacterized DUF497 family protein
MSASAGGISQSTVLISPPWTRCVEEVDMRHDYGETRIKAIGEAKGVIVSVVYTWRGARRRLISARRARADERKEYQAKLGAA